ncbi:MAG: phosphoribosylformylglycinamidine cyclo-ligase [Gemmatimonadales bacterium]
MSPTDKYRRAGVDLDRAEELKRRIAETVASTRTRLATGIVGDFGGMVRVPPDVAEPVLVTSTDGVGTKVLVAIRAGRHDTVGEDLVNHSVNDILVHGATPLAFLDYIAGANVAPDTVAALVEGVARGCRAHEMTLAGGETAQMPDMYAPGHYDLAGTIVGVVPRERVLDRSRVEVGDTLVGFASNGLHTNGYSLARRIVFDTMGLEADGELGELGATVGDALLAIHRSYWHAISPSLGRVHALAHITGGGIPGNLSRSLPTGCAARVDRAAWPVPPIFRLLAERGGVSDDEMYRVFNMGVGLIAIVPPSDVDPVRAVASRAGVESWVVGEVVAGEGVRLV